ALSDDEEISRLFSCNAIHLSGGHTGYFLRRLRQSDMLDKLSAWALDDGILVGKRVEIDEGIEKKPVPHIVKPFLIEKRPLRVRTGRDIADAV
ncbi:hypothetical protein ACC739_36830, partial [Rhizobium ruizarguesonis]